MSTTRYFCPFSCTEIRELRSALARSRRAYANLLAAVRCALAAEAEGESDPLYYLRDELP